MKTTSQYETFNNYQKMRFNVIYPDLKHCGDNVVMIAWRNKRYKKSIDNLDIPAKSRWPLDEKAQEAKGPGLKL